MSTQAICIAAVVVTFNRLVFLKKTVDRSLQAGVDHLVIVNNASTDGTGEWLRSLSLPHLVVIDLPVNVGGAGGFHHGFAHVIEHTHADWLVCYDDDAYPSASCFNTFRDMRIPAQVAGIAAAVYLPDGHICEMNRPSLNPFGSMRLFLRTLWHGRSGFHVRDEAYEQQDLIAIDFSSFVGCFLRTQAIRQKLGLPRKALFIYADDILYTHGIGRSGWAHCFAPQLKFVHECVTLHGQLPVYTPLWKAYYTYRNGLEMYRQIAGPALFYPIALLKLLVWLAQARHYEHRAAYLRLTWRAWCDGMRRDFSRPHAQVLQFSQGPAQTDRLAP